MNKLAGVQSASPYGFTFIGNNNASLLQFTDKSFVMSPYYGDEYLEYDFEGQLLNKYTRDEYEKKFDSVKSTVAARNNTIKNVVEIAVKEAEHTTYNNQSVFQPIISIEQANESEGEEWICGDITLTRWISKNPLFIISSANDVISLARFDKHQYLDGDSGTRVYVLNQKNILMLNDGDCPSVLLFKNNSTVLPANPLPRKMISSARTLTETFNELNQAIVNFLYEFYDEDKYAVYVCSDAKYIIKCRATDQLILTVKQKGAELQIILDKCSLTVDIDSLDYETVKAVRKLTENTLKKC
jgi:hypothetical protein